jgi:ABC-type sugar transport system substrate-binding protein
LGGCEHGHRDAVRVCGQTVTDNEADLVEQVGVVEQMISRQVDAIVVAPHDRGNAQIVRDFVVGT